MNNRDKPMSICLFGGTFDPIHLGHLHIAKAAVDALDLDKVILLPCRQSPHKAEQARASAQDRLAMCRLATSTIDWAEVDDHDLTTSPPCYSWRTAEAMAARFPGARLFWLMGTDQWQALPRWNHPERLASLVEFIVHTRAVAPEPRTGYQLHTITGHHPASATEIRASIQQSSHTDWLAPEVREYIDNNKLYLANDTVKQNKEA
jgi:nicotinate-nucleotide adenylyltransferase